MPPLEWLSTSKSLAPIAVLVSVKLTMVAAAKAAPLSVISPHFLLSVTPVDLLVACVTTPPSLLYAEGV